MSVLLIIMVTLFGSTCLAAEKKTDESIFAFKNELSITETQEKNLRDIIAKLQKYLDDATVKLNGLRSELSDLISQKADLTRIHTLLTMIAMIQADASYEDIATARAMENELTEVQLVKWHVMQQEFRKKNSTPQ